MSTETNEFPERKHQEQDNHPVDLLGEYALGSLDPDEIEFVARHIQSCSRCRTTLAGYDNVVGMLPYAAPQYQVPIRARAGLLSRLDEVGSTNEQQMVVLPAIPREAAPRFPWLRLPASPRMAAFAAVPLVLILAIVGIMANVINDQQQQIATIESEQAAEQAAVDKVLFGNSGTTQPAEATFVSSITAPDAMAKLIVNYETNSALILARNLPVASDGTLYIAWLRLTEPNEYAKAGVLTVADDGRASLSVEPRDAIENYIEVIVTIETDPEVSAPVGPQVMTAAVVPEP